MPPPPEEAPPDDALDAIYAPPPDFPPPEDEEDAFAAQMARNARAKWQQEYARIPSGLLGGLPPPPATAGNSASKPPPPAAAPIQQQQQQQQQVPAGRQGVAKQGSFAASPQAASAPASAASSPSNQPAAPTTQGSTNRRGLNKTRAQPSLALPVGGVGGGGAEPSPRCDPVDSLLLARYDGRQRTAYADARAAILARPLMGARGNSTLPETVPMRRMPLPYAVEPRLRALLSVGEVRFELGVIEPFYMTFAIHDRRRGLKLTEEFACDSHNDAVLQLIGGGQGNVDIRTRCRQAMFSLDPALAGSRDLVLIMRMSKQLNNEIEKDQAPYLDPKKSKANSTATLAQEAALLCRNPQPWKYRQPFAWSFRSLFLPNGEIDQRPARLDMYVARAGALADEQLYELIDNIPLLKKQKTIPGHVDTEVFDVTAKFEKIKGRVDASMVPVGPRASDGQVVRHILEFGGDAAALSVAYQALLYIYPDQMHVSVKQKEMNVQVRVSCDHTTDDPESAAKFFCKHDLHVRTAEEVSLVQRKEKKPQLMSEMKMMLPAVLSATSALRFTFHNIDIKGGAYKPAPFAFAVLPLFRDGRLIEDGEHVLQLTEDMPTGDSEVIGHKGELKKMMFSLRTAVESTAHISDEHFNNFFRDSVRHIGAVMRIAPPTIMQLFPVLASRLVQMLCSQAALQQPAFGAEAFGCLMHVLQTVDQQQQSRDDLRDPATGQSKALSAWLHYSFENPHAVPGLAYDEIARHWVQHRAKGINVAGSRLNWLLLGMILKSMALKVAASGELARGGSRKQWYSGQFVEVLRNLVRTFFTPRDHALMREFLRDLPRFYEYGAALRLNYDYVEWLRLTDADRDFSQRALFFGALALNEQFLALNLPVPVTLDAIHPDNFETVFMQRHVLVALLLRHFRLMLTSGLPTVAAVHKLVDVLQDWMMRVDVDPRISNHAGARQAAADLFLPFVTLMCEHVKLLLQRLSSDVRLRLFRCVVFVVRSCSRDLLRGYYGAQTQIVQEGLLVLLTDALVSEQTAMVTPHSEAVAQRGAEPTTPPSGASADAPPTPTTRAAMMKQNSSATLGTHGRAPSGGGNEPLEALPPARVVKRQPTANELEHWSVSSAAVCDVVHLFLEDFSSECNKQGSRLFSRALHLLHLMFTHATSEFVPHVYATLHLVVHRFRQPLFAHTDNSYCEMLTLMILSHCNSRSAQRHSRARALYFGLLMANYEEAGNFAKMKLQSIIAVSKLLGGGEYSEFDCLQSSLTAIAEHAAAQRETAQHPIVPFLAQLSELFGTLIKYQAQIARSAHDPEKLADLYYNISNGYSDSPDLRVAWLENLGQMQRQNDNLAESAHSKLHQAALVVAYLAHTGAAPLPLATLLTAVPNHGAELGLPPFDATEFASKVWTKEALVELLQEAVKLLQEAQLYEEAITVYQMLLSVLQYDSNYQLMVSTLADFKQVCETLVAADSAQARLAPNYYRVGLYGAAFGAELNGKEFVYKVSPSYTLGHFQKKLTTQFGADVPNIEVLTTNKDLDPAELDANKSYIQIGAVKPYLEDGGAGVFSHVKRFVFEAAYSAGNKKAISEDDFSKQQKRKVIFTTEQSMPYLKARVPVVSRAELILSAADNSIEMMSERVEKLRSELRFNPPRQNSLQQVIQGSVVPMVNGGPVKICEIFLGQQNKDMTPAKRKQLAVIMIEFLNLCGRALVVNKSIITSTHVKFQAMCEKYFDQMRVDVLALVEKSKSIS